MTTKRIATYSIAIAVLLIVSVVFISFDRGFSSPNNGVIRSSGRYPSRDGRYTVIVDTKRDNIVKYVMLDTATEAILIRGKAGNAYMKYFLCWDSANNLWIDSEDTSRVLLNKKGGFVSHDLTSDDLKRSSDFPKAPLEFVKSD